MATSDELGQELLNQLSYWRERLRLEDWTVSLKVCRSLEMSDPYAVAECIYYLERKDAIISILHPDDAALLSERFIQDENMDLELSLVHELLHLHYAPFHADESSHTSIAQEQSINSISKALVTLKREQSAQVMGSASASHGHYL